MFEVERTIVAVAVVAVVVAAVRRLVEPCQAKLEPEVAGQRSQERPYNLDIEVESYSTVD